MIDSSHVVTTEDSGRLPIPKQFLRLPDSVPAEDPQQEADGSSPGMRSPHEALEFLESKGVLFFRDQHGETYAWIPANDGKQGVAILLNSKECMARLFRLVKTDERTDSYREVLRRAIQLAELAAFDEPKKELSVRNAWEKGELLIDLNNGVGTTISVTANGWQVRHLDRPKFVRYRHMKQLPIPQEGASVKDLFGYFPDMDDGTQLLILAWIVCSMCPHFITPILTFVGPPASAKTTRSRKIRDLVDPSEVPVIGETKLNDLQLIFRSHAAPCFENVGKFNRNIADLFCRAVTGDGIQKRKLYTDSDDVIFRFRRSIIVNGINVPSTRTDFLERCLVIKCEKIKQFKSEHSIETKFEADRPRLFGAILDLTVEVLRRLPVIDETSEFRLRDFAMIGRAVAAAIGASADDFDAAYRDKLQYGTSIFRDDNPMLDLIRDFSADFTDAKPWKGSASELLTRLRERANSKGNRIAVKDLPGNGRWLSVRLFELDGLLAEEGVRIERDRSSTIRKLKIYNSRSPEKVAQLTNELNRDEEGGGHNE